MFLLLTGCGVSTTPFNNLLAVKYILDSVFAPGGARVDGRLTAEISFAWRWIALEPCRESESYEERFYHRLLSQVNNMPKIQAC